MSRLPSIPPSTPGDPASRRPRATMASQIIHTPPPPPSPAPRRESQPAQVPLNLTDPPDTDTDLQPGDVSIEDILRESHTLPKVVLALSSLMALSLAGLWGYRTGVEVQSGGATAMLYMLYCLVALAIASANAGASAWVVSKIFNEDFGTFGVVTLRFSAVAAAQFPVLAGLAYLVGVYPALVFMFNIPIMIVVTILVAGVDLFRAIVFSVITGVVNLSIASFALVSLSPPAV